MSFGSDTPGGSVEGIGGREEGIGGGAGNTGGGTPVAQAIAALSPIDQEAFFRSRVDPLASSAYGKPGQTMEKLAGFVGSGLLNAMAPGLGTLANLTGLTGKATEALTDVSFSQALAEDLGISNTPEGVSPESMRGEDVLKVALQAGISPQTIEQSYNKLIQQQGGSMGLWDSITGEGAASAATGAAGTQASYQQQALDYLKEMGAIPLAAQQQLAGVYGLPGGTGSQAELIEQAKASPLYSQILGGRDAGEEAILRQAGATGGLRSGNVQSNLYDYNTRLANEALTQAYGQQLGGLTGLAGMGTYAPQAAQTISGIGTTLASGQTAAAQAEQQGYANLLGLGGTIYKELGGVSGITDTASDIWDTVSGWF